MIYAYQFDVIRMHEIEFHSNLLNILHFIYLTNSFKLNFYGFYRNIKLNEMQILWNSTATMTKIIHIFHSDVNLCFNIFIYKHLKISYFRRGAIEKIDIYLLFLDSVLSIV